jgi:hypothetical protein
MMLEEPNLIDADAFGELDLLELAPEHFRMGRVFAWCGRRPNGESHRLILPEVLSDSAPRQRSHGRRHDGFRQSLHPLSPPVSHQCRSALDLCRRAGSIDLD